MKRLKPDDISGRISLISNFAQGSSAAMRVHNASILSSMGAPLLQIPAFVAVVLATRGLISEGGHGMDVGGAGWFLDLTVADNTLILPCMAVASTYLNLELSLGKLQAQTSSKSEKGPDGGSPLALQSTDPEGPRESSPAVDVHDGDPSSENQAQPASPPPAPATTPPTSPMSLKLKDWVQTALVIGLPLVATLPTGAFVYWLTSSVFTTTQIILLRDGHVRKALGLPPIKLPQR
jgi:membrane protein insertase Oxa1/YidC/SpoIIIJ